MTNKPTKPGKHHIRRNEPLSLAQTKAIVTRRIMGNSVKQIAEEFQMSHDTVQERLKWASRNGLVESALDHVLEKIVPEALKTYLLAIQGGDVDAARDVMFGTGVLQKNPVSGQAPMTTVEMTIEQYRQERQSVAASLMAQDAPRSGLLYQGPIGRERLPSQGDPSAPAPEVDGDRGDDGLPAEVSAADDPEASEDL